MHSLVKTFQRTHNGIFTTNTCKHPTLPLSLLKSHFTLHLTSLLFPLYPPWWFSVDSASPPKEKGSWERTWSWNPYFIFYCISSLDHEIHWTFSCYPSLQLLFPALAWISSKMLFIFASLHKPLGVSSLILALFQALSSLLIFLLFLHSHIWLLHLVLPLPAAHHTVLHGVILSHWSPPLPIASRDDIRQYSGYSPSLSSFPGDLSHPWGFSFHVCVQGIVFQSRLLYSSLGSDVSEALCLSVTIDKQRGS